MTEQTIAELFDLTGRCALITGGTGHLGSSMSRALAEAGASVILCSRSAERAQDSADQLPQPVGQTHYGVQLDQLSEDYYADPAPEGIVGSGGHQLFVFEALATGRSNLVLSYERSPEDVAETLTLKIRVID